MAEKIQIREGLACAECKKCRAFVRSKRIVAENEWESWDASAVRLGAAKNPPSWPTLRPAHHQHGIQPAESERVRDGRANRGLARDIGHNVQIAFGILFFVIRGRRHGLAVERECRCSRLQCARASQPMREN